MISTNVILTNEDIKYQIVGEEYRSLPHISKYRNIVLTEEGLMMSPSCKFFRIPDSVNNLRILNNLIYNCDHNKPF